jgi:hypothetical protein
MGARSIDRASAVELRAVAETVETMRRFGWEVVSACPACGLRMRVDLARAVRDLGPDASLWNRHPPCRRIGCDGRVTFEVRPRGAGHLWRLEAPKPTRETLQRSPLRHVLPADDPPAPDQGPGGGTRHSRQS